MLRSIPVILVGFSKGCSVLNQVMHELPNCHSDVLAENFVRKIQALYWLDSGNCGHSGAWVTNERLLQLASSLIPSFYVHVTPYQMTDTHRKWMVKEKKLFIERLKDYKANVTEIYHFEGNQASLNQHFSLLKKF